jgi:hypothetical protein
LADDILDSKDLIGSIVNAVYLNFASLTASQRRLATRSHLLTRALILFLCLGVFGGAAAANPSVQAPPAAPLGRGLPFAIADLDGDLRPDVASVQAGAHTYGSTEYWVQLELSSAGRQFIRLVGPEGGLLVEARDVNGDHAVDLVFVTAWFRQPVAILLNDGHGSFSQAEPAAYSQAFSGSSSNWTSASDPSLSALGFPPESRAGACLQPSGFGRAPSHAGSVSGSSPEFLFDSTLALHAGRSPPSQVSHF